MPGVQSPCRRFSTSSPRGGSSSCPCPAALSIGFVDVRPPSSLPSTLQVSPNQRDSLSNTQTSKSLPRLLSSLSFLNISHPGQLLPSPLKQAVSPTEAAPAPLWSGDGQGARRWSAGHSCCLINAEQSCSYTLCLLPPPSPFSLQQPQGAFENLKNTPSFSLTQKLPVAPIILEWSPLTPCSPGRRPSPCPSPWLSLLPLPLAHPGPASAPSSVLLKHTQLLSSNMPNSFPPQDLCICCALHPGCPSP